MKKITTTLISLINSTFYMSFLKDVHLGCQIKQRQIYKLPPLVRFFEAPQQLTFFKETEAQRRRDLAARVRTRPRLAPYYFPQPHVPNLRISVGCTPTED